jgi:SAM-dependent methyltransferase
MKSYEILADYYDKLIIDAQGIADIVHFFTTHHYANDVLEIACGTGAITKALIEKGYKVSGFDLSMTMIDKAKAKINETEGELFVDDMRFFNLNERFNNIICFNDSLNYLSDINELDTVFKRVYDHLESNGVFMFDVHSEQRRLDLQDEYIEEGYLDSTPYQWVIESEDDKIYHTLTFYINNTPVSEYHMQTVFTKDKIKELLLKNGFEYTVYTDYDKPEDAKGDKWFFVAKRR